MKLRFWMMGLAGILACATGSAAITYYVDDNSNDGDVYTPDYTGNDSNDGLSPSSPKLTINNLLASTNLLPGDVVLIDTGTYTNNVVIGTSVNGTATNRIAFQGSTNFVAGGATFAPTNIVDVLVIGGRYLHFRDIRISGGANGFFMNGAKDCLIENGLCNNSQQGLRFVGTASNNVVRRCTFLTTIFAALGGEATARNNYVENCVARSQNSAAYAPAQGVVTALVSSIGIGTYALGNPGFKPDAGSHNIFHYSQAFSPDYETLSDFQRVATNWVFNTVADPKFVNATGLDFHLLSASGFISNGVWVTNPAVGYSPGIDFGPRE